MPTREAIADYHVPVLHRGVIVAVLPVGATWPASSDLGMNLELWIGSDVALPMTFVAFEMFSPRNGPRRSGIGLSPRAESPYSLEEITKLIESNPGAELRLRG